MNDLTDEWMNHLAHALINSDSLALEAAATTALTRDAGQTGDAAAVDDRLLRCGTAACRRRRIHHHSCAAARERRARSSPR
jgi:hypothetical protein